MKPSNLSPLACLLMLFLISCQENLSVVDPAPFIGNDSTLSIESAQLIYDNFLQQKALARVATVDLKNSFEKKLQWQYAQKEKFANGTSVVLISLDPRVNNYTHGTVSLTSQPTTKPDGFAEIFTTRKAVIYRREGKEHIEFMTVIGKQTNKEQTSFLNNSTGFTGAVLFQDDNNIFLL